jgi:hypothetical protein
VAVKKGRHSDPRAVKIDVVEHEGGVTICAVYPSVDGKANECAPGKGGRMNTRDNDVNVEFKLSVPAGVRFVGRTVNGGIDARGLSADAEATTVNGGVDLESTGTARAETVNGGITARFGRSDWNGTMKLATVKRRDRRDDARRPLRRGAGRDGQRRHLDRLSDHRRRQVRPAQAQRHRSARADACSR